MSKIMLSHGGGGEEMNSLINETIFRIFNDEILRESNDSAILNLGEICASQSAAGLRTADKCGANSANERAAGELDGGKFDAKDAIGERVAGEANLSGERVAGESRENSVAQAKAVSDKKQNSNLKPQIAPSEASNSALKFSGKLAFSTDSFVVTPIFFNGGDIGKIAACGTINDLAMVGAIPKYLSCALIVEEGLELADLERVLGSLAAVARENGVRVVCGDTKVVPRGKCDKIFINTSGIGEIVCEGVELKSLRAGAKILLSGDVGRHGAVVLAGREELDLQSDLKSDCKTLCGVVKALIEGGVKPLCMRDATRGGLSAVLNEWAKFSGLDILVREEDIRVIDEVTGVCELFGFEPYELANEGTFVLAVDEKDEALALEILREFDGNAASIGEILSAENGRVILQNAYGSKRFLEAPKGELLPRIC